MKQTTSHILMVRPGSFRTNEETAVNNFFQDQTNEEKNANGLAQQEFDNTVDILRSEGIEVFVLQDSGEYDTPDSLFPNNIISFHGDRAILYPMFAPNRRREHLLQPLAFLKSQGISYSEVLDYTPFVEENLFLEGTGVLVLDRINRIAYCSLSERANEELVHLFCKDNEYIPIIFHATQLIDNKREPVYHTNVMMALGTSFCVICLDSILAEQEKSKVIQALINTNKTIITISEAQMNHFCGNILELHSIDGQPLIVMSEQAYKTFTKEQKDQLSLFGKIVTAPIYTIERLGGGSLRCMIAEIF
ncbi:citrulline utilization hydrolase CtlX [Sphingobacterium thermophilum]|uniref:Arginine deiminase-related protein n=2 Tax=Sphingobacterium TaxID=28453 RepID=A0ABP8R8L9_9SPHI